MLVRGVSLTLTALSFCIPQIQCLVSPSASVELPSTDLDPTQNIAPISGLSEDPKCAKGKPGFESNVWQFAVPASTWINRTGSFLHSEWYVGPNNSTSGMDNMVGATRTTLLEGTSLFSNKLVGYHRSPTQSVQRFQLVNGPVSFKNLTFYSYTEEFRATSICGGTAVYYTMTANFCTDNPVGMYKFYDAYRKEKVQSLADELGAVAFNGTCPIGVVAANGTCLGVVAFNGTCPVANGKFWVFVE
ncbi:hypothetical protein C0995_007527 [Termitomyces sp. Mi166|nr:hypothetical protein C0995_007527 [Termitomyces sp. Mi166\